MPDDSSPSFSGRPGSLVALKATYPIAMAPPHDSRREIRVLKRAASEHVISLWETFTEAAGHLVLVFPHMPLDLEHMLNRRTMTRAQERACLKDLFSALAHVHDLGIIHRDIKPANVMLQSPSGPSYLIDFGIAWDPKDPASEKSDEKITDVGTTSYRAPELLFGCRTYGPAIDMWAAGCVAAEVVRRQKQPLFNSGELGSDLALIHSIFERLGTPNESNWPVGAITSLHEDKVLRSPPRKRRHCQTGARYHSWSIRLGHGPNCSQTVSNSPGS